MNYFLRKIEAALLPTANQYAPEGSDPKAMPINGYTRSQAETNRLRQNIRPILVELPPKELMTAFTKTVTPPYAQITAKFHQACNLVTPTRCAAAKGSGEIYTK